MKVSITANTNGKGLHSDEAREVLITTLGMGYRSTDYYPDLPFSGELRAYFDPTGYGEGAWHVGSYGLICSDKKWLTEFKRGLRGVGLSDRSTRDITYNVQALQGNNYVSLNVGPTFYASWSRLKFV